MSDQPHERAGGERPDPRRERQQRQEDERERARQGTILLVSRDAAFVEAVGRMVNDSGFRADTVVDGEPAWLSLTRTQPRVVVCDCDHPGRGARLLVVEAAARRVPLLLFQSESDAEALRTLAGDGRVGWLTLPMTPTELSAAIDGILPPPTLRLMRPTAKPTPASACATASPVAPPASIR